MTRPMPGPPEWYDIDWNPTWGMVRVHYPDKWDRTFSHAELDKKRLTDAECAAEYWRAMHNVLRYGEGDPGQNKAIRRADTWYRFATHSHALEVNP